MPNPNDNNMDPLDALAAMGNGASQPQPAAAPAPQQSDDPLDALANMKPAQQPAAPSFFERVKDAIVHPPMSGFTQASQLQGAPESTPDQASSVVRGAEKTALQTAAPVARAAGVAVNPEETTTHGIGEAIGGIAENIAEAVGAEGVLKGLGLADRLKQIHAVADAYEKAGPVARKAIEYGLNSARNAAAGAAVGGVHGGESGAVTGAVAGAAAEPVAAVAGKVAGAASNALSGLWNSVSGRAIQSGLQAGVRSIVSDVADDAGVKAPTGSIRTSLEQVADGVQAKSKGLFDQIDQATGGEYTNLTNKLRNVEYKLRDITGTDDTAENKLLEQGTMLRSRIDDAIEAAKKAGVDPSVADEARAAWRQMSALRDVDAAVKASTTGNVKNAPEVVNPSTLATRLQKLEDTGRLAEGMGKDAADSLLQHAYDAKQAVINRVPRVELAKMAGKYVGAGTLLGGAAEAAHKLIKEFE